MEEAVIIYANNTMEGISLEYQFVGKKEGQRGVDWNLVQQSLQHDNDKDYDVLVIKLNKSNEEKTYYFDITNFFGKF
jgi:predicted RNA-binding protein associated with RNAse of E/G family